MSHADHLRNLRLLASSCLLPLTLATVGCSMGNITLSGPVADTSTSSGLTITGVAHGGQNPVIGASLQLYVAGEPAAPTTGNPIVGGFGQGAVALITPGSMTAGSSNNYWPNGAGTGATCPISGAGINTNNCTALPQTDANGFFTVTSDYTAPSGTAQVYIVATGGNAGGGTNPAIALMAGLGSYSGISSGSYVFINEVTTVGAVWALQNFMAPPSGAAASTYTTQGGTAAGIPVNVGASSGPVGGYGGLQTQQIGLNNAFRMIPNLVNNSNGTTTPVNAWATNYSAKEYLIADILANCVNSGSLAASANCSNLMTAAKNTSYTPADTIQAAWMMAHNPMLNTVTLSGLVNPQFPFPTTLSVVPDWTLPVAFSPTLSGGNYAATISQSIAIDAKGHAWVYNTGGSIGITTPFISEFDANGAALAGPFQTYSVPNTAGLTCPSAANPTTHTLTAGNYPFAIDQNGLLWGATSTNPRSIHRVAAPLRRTTPLAPSIRSIPDQSAETPPPSITAIGKPAARALSSSTPTITSGGAPTTPTLRASPALASIASVPVPMAPAHTREPPICWAMFGLAPPAAVLRPPRSAPLPKANYSSSKQQSPFPPLRPHSMPQRTPFTPVALQGVPLIPSRP